MPRQLVLDLPVRTALGRDDFFVSPSNALAVAMVEQPSAWPDRRLALVGPEGSGKSHLATIWADRAGAAIVAAAALAGTDWRSLGPPALVVEDADRIAGDLAAETALFHLCNHAAISGQSLLLTARRDPAAWPLALPDLASRMTALAVARLAAPDDALLSALIVKLFADRQVHVAPAVVAFAVGRIDRSFAAARAFVAATDARALALGRPVTRAVAAEILDSSGPGVP